MGVVLRLLVVPPPPLVHVALWGSLLWRRLCLPGIFHVVAVGVLLGAGRTGVLLVKISLVFLKFNKRTHKQGRMVASPGAVGGLLVCPPRCCCHLGPVLVAAVAPVGAAPREPLVPVPVPYM